MLKKMQFCQKLLFC